MRGEEGGGKEGRGKVQKASAIVQVIQFARLVALEEGGRGERKEYEWGRE